MNNNSTRVCPVEGAGHLESKFRRWLQNPQKILKPYIKDGMTVLDMGCGPGFFALDIAQLVGTSGRVIAADLQDGMLQMLKKNLQNSELASRIILHQCEKNKIGVTTKVDFVLLFFVAHEIPDHPALFKELHSILNPDGQILIVEPPLHVPKAEFETTIQTAQTAGFSVINRPKVFLCNAVLLKKSTI